MSMDSVVCLYSLIDWLIKSCQLLLQPGEVSLNPLVVQRTPMQRNVVDCVKCHYNISNQTRWHGSKFRGIGINISLVKRIHVRSYCDGTNQIIESQYALDQCVSHPLSHLTLFSPVVSLKLHICSY